MLEDKEDFGRLIPARAQLETTGRHGPLLGTSIGPIARFLHLIHGLVDKIAKVHKATLRFLTRSERESTIPREGPCVANDMHLERTRFRADGQDVRTDCPTVTTVSTIPGGPFFEFHAINGTGQTGRNESYALSDRAVLAELPGSSCWFARSDDPGYDGTGQE